MNDFDIDIQKQLISYMMTDANSFALSANIIDYNYFDKSLQETVNYIFEYSNEFRTLPSFDIIKATTKVALDPFVNAEQHNKWYLSTIEKFCRKRALEIVMMRGFEAMETGKDYDLERAVKDAQSISLVKDLGTSYFENPFERLQRLKDRTNLVPTGWGEFDAKLYGGLAKDSLTIFAGKSGEGKSLILQNLALNWAAMGKNVVYVSLELSEDLISLRLDAMTTGTGTTEVNKDIKAAHQYVRSFAKKNQVGDLRVKRMKSGTTTNDIRAYLKEYEIQTGKKLDAVIVDYLDLMYPNNAKIDVSNMFTKDKYVSEELRDLGLEWDMPVVTASQFNRGAVETEEFDHSHIAGGISKINTADNLVYINAPKSMKERGEYEVIFGKTRSSASNGDKIRFAYNINSMRITDKNSIPDDITLPYSSAQNSTNLNNLDDYDDDDDADDNKDKLLDLLSSIKSGRA